MKTVDLFSGAGGMTLGFRSAGAESIDAVEADRFAAETFALNFSDVPVHVRTAMDTALWQVSATKENNGGGVSSTPLRTGYLRRFF